MALYFKCDNCKTKFIDYYGEYAHDYTKECYLYGPYDCPICNNLIYEGITPEEYKKCNYNEYKK